MENRNLRRRNPIRVEVPVGSVRLVESHHADDFMMKREAWPFHKIGWVAVGRGVLESEDSSRPLEEDDFFLLSADWPHRFVDQPGEPLTLVILCLSREFVGDRGTRQIADLWAQGLERHASGVPCRARSGFHRTALIEQFRLGLREQENRMIGWETGQEAVASRILVSMGRGYCVARPNHCASTQSAIQGAVEYVQAHPYEKLQIEEMAERCGISARRFTELFKAQTKETFSQFLNRERIRYACRRLDETGHILYACHESGFNDVAYFYRVFRKFTGQTPGEYLAGTDPCGDR